MEAFGWTPDTVKELDPGYQDELLTIMNERAAALRKRRK